MILRAWRADGMAGPRMEREGVGLTADMLTRGAGAGLEQSCLGEDH